MGFVSVRSGQRDDTEFDYPDEFRPDRTPVRALMCGGGIYNCVGQHLARLLAVCTNLNSEISP